MPWNLNKLLFCGAGFGISSAVHQLRSAGAKILQPTPPQWNPSRRFPSKILDVEIPFQFCCLCVGLWSSRASNVRSGRASTACTRRQAWQSWPAPLASPRHSSLRTSPSIRCPPHPSRPPSLSVCWFLWLRFSNPYFLVEPFACARIQSCLEHQAVLYLVGGM